MPFLDRRRLHHSRPGFPAIQTLRKNHPQEAEARRKPEAPILLLRQVVLVDRELALSGQKSRGQRRSAADQRPYERPAITDDLVDADQRMQKASQEIE